MPSEFPLSRFPYVQTNSLDEARSLYERMTTPIVVEQTGSSVRRQPFVWQSYFMKIGSLQVSTHRLGAGVLVKSPFVENNFTVTFPIAAATGEANVAGTVVPMARGKSAPFASPGRSSAARMSGGYESIQVDIVKSDMEAALAALSLEQKSAPLHFDPSFNLEGSTGAAVERMVRFAINEADRGDNAFAAPLVAARFADAVLFNLLLGQVHSHTALINVRETPAEPRHVSRAGEYLTANATSPIRLAALPQITGVSLRTLQTAFLKHRGVTLTGFLLERRLELAHQQLLRGLAGLTVTGIALDCGFMHLGRFSAMYRRRYRESPSATLARARPRR